MISRTLSVVGAMALTLLASLCFSGHATAADMPAKAPPLAASSWGGFYIGGHVGYARTNNASFTISDPFGVWPIDPTTSSFSDDGAIFGIHGGYNWQFAPQWMIGIEADWSRVNFSLSSSGPFSFNLGFPAPNSTLSGNMDIKNIASVRGRFGYTAPMWMLYATGGVAWADVDYRSSMSCCGPPLFATQTAFSKTASGWVLGGGVEARMHAQSPIIFGVEYLFYRLNTEASETGTLSVAVAPCLPGVPCNPVSFSDIDIHTVRARVGYKF